MVHIGIRAHIIRTHKRVREFLFTTRIRAAAWTRAVFFSHIRFPPPIHLAWFRGARKWRGQKNIARTLSRGDEGKLRRPGREKSTYEGYMSSTLSARVYQVAVDRAGIQVRTTCVTHAYTGPTHYAARQTRTSFRRPSVCTASDRLVVNFPPPLPFHPPNLKHLSTTNYNCIRGTMYHIDWWSFMVGFFFFCLGLRH